MTTDELRAKFEAWASEYQWSRDRQMSCEEDDSSSSAWQAAHASRDAEVEALRKDAERYRWLRNSDRIPDGDYLDTHLVVTDASGEDVLWNNSLDVTIDAAMQAE